MSNIRARLTITLTLSFSKPPNLEMEIKIKMKTYIATDQYGKTVTVSAYTESDARQQAESELGYGNVISFREI